MINNKSVNTCTPVDISGVSNTPNMHDLFRLMEGISLEVKSLNVRVFDRIATLLKTFAKNVVENMCKMVDGKIQKEIGKVKNELGSEINEVKTKISEVEKACEPLRSAIESVRSDFEKDMSTLQSNVVTLQKSYADAAKQTPVSAADISLNVIVRNLPESPNENVANKVNALIRDGLKIKDVSVVSAERKTSRKENEHGLIVAKCSSADDKKKIMTNKRHLKSDRKYSKVYINHDMCKNDRVLVSNLKSIAKAVGHDKLVVKGNKICARTGRDHSDHRTIRDENRPTRGASGGRGRGGGARGRR